MLRIALLIALLFPCLALAGPQLYTSDTATGDISRITQQGQATEVLLENFLNPLFIEVDEPGEKVYWGSSTKMMRANLDGSNLEVLFDQSDGLGFVGGIALDVAGSRLFLIDYIRGAILRGNLDGSGSLITVFDASNSVFQLQDIEFNPNDQRLYWSNLSGLYRGNADGSGAVQNIFQNVGVGISGLALDVAASRIYWADQADSLIYRGNMDGSGIPQLLFDAGDNVFAPLGIDLDLVSNRIMWTNSNGQVRRGNLDGSGPSQLIYSNLSGGYGIAHAPSAQAIFLVSGSDVLTGPKTGGTLSKLVDFTLRDISATDLIPDIGSNYLYLADAGRNPRIIRAALDFGGSQSSVSPSTIETLYTDETDAIHSPRALALHRPSGFLYWANDYLMIQRGSLDGSLPVETLFTVGDGLFSPQSLVVSPSGDFIYWTDRTTKKISRGNADGSGAPTVLFGEPDGLMQPYGLDIDFTAGKIYWSDLTTKKIQRGNIDGGGAPEDLFIAADGVEFPDRLKLNKADGRIYWLERDIIKFGSMNGTGLVGSLPTNAAVTLAGLALIQDSDEDGVPDEIDQCPVDPAKTLPLVCGCGNPDLDLNQNGVLDCLINQDLKARLETLSQAVRSLTRKSSAEVRASVKALAVELAGILTADQGSIQIQSTETSLKQWGKRIQKQSAQATKVKSKDLKKRKKQALRSIGKLQSELL